MGAVLLGMASAADAATVGNLGINPTSATGRFDSPVGGTGGTGSGAFSDQVFFQLAGGPAFFTIASALNVFPGGNTSTDFISNFTGSLFFTNNTVSTADDIQIIGPVAATPCTDHPDTCQGFSGSTTLTLLGRYYLQLDGIGGGTSGYGGNLAVVQTPIPGALALFAGGLAGLGWLSRRRKQQSLTA